jgi:hypothetical protein
MSSCAASQLPWCGTQPFDSLYTFSSDLCGCNGNGDATLCALQEFCACNAGWSGRADFSAGGYSCHVFEPAIVSLWALVLASVVLTYVVCGRRMYELSMRFLATRQRVRAKGKPYSLRNNRSLGLFLATLPAILATAIIRLADPGQRIALSWLMSTAWFLSLSSYYLATHKYNTALATSALKAEQASGNLVARYRWMGRGFCFAQTCSLALAVPVYVDGGFTQSLSRGLMTSYLAWVAVVMFAFTFFLRVVKNHIRAVLATAAENASLRDRMTLVYDTCIAAALFQALAFFLMAVIPVLWTAHDYILPITFLSIPYVTWRFVNSIYMPQSLVAKDGKSNITNASNRMDNNSQSVLP